MLGIIHRMYDLTPNSPVTVTDGVAVSCSNVRTIYPVGSEYVRHAFVVLQDADIVVKNAGGNTLQRGTDYFTISRAMDQLYSKQYSTSVFSGIQFKATGTYTVTSFLSCGTYPRASWYNYALETLLAVINTSIPAMQAAVNNFSSSLSDMTETVMQIAQTVTSHGTRLTVLESNPTIIVVADHATMLAIASVKIGTTVYVVADTDGKRAEYLYDGTTYQKTSDPDWENINIEWSALLNIPTGVAALIAGTLTSTALADMPTPADADNAKVLSWDKTTGKYVLLTVSAAAGVGDVSGPVSSTDEHVALFDGATGKIIKDSGYPFARCGKIEWYDDYIAPATDFPYLCLSDDDKILNAANWPDLVPYLRAKKLKYMPGTSSEQSAFSVTNYAVDYTSNTVMLTFADLLAEKTIIAGLAEDQLVHGSFTNWRTITLPEDYSVIPAGTYAITAISAANRTVSFVCTNTSASGQTPTSTAVFYSHRVADTSDASGTMARHFAMKGRSLVSNDAASGCFAGLRRRDRMQGHFHTTIIGDFFSSALSPKAFGIIGTTHGAVAAEIGAPKTDGTNGIPRTGSTTDPRSLIAMPYMWGKRYVA